MKEAAAAKHDFSSALTEWDARSLPSGPPWLQKLRRSSAARFKALGFPGPREEEWRQTSVAAAVAVPFERAAAPGGGGPKALAGLAQSGSDTLRLVFVDGFHSAALSTKNTVLGIEASSLAATLLSGPERVEADFGKTAPSRDHAFAALNTAWFADGAFVAIPDGTVMDEPIQIVHLSGCAANPSASFPRAFIRVGRGCRVTLVETYTSLSEGAALTNAVSEIVVGEDSALTHIRIQDESRAAFHVGQVQYRQGRNSRLQALQVSLGAALARYDIGATLAEPGAESTLDGLYLAGTGQHVDHHTTLDHAAAHCASHEMYKGVLTDNGRAVFNGRIIVRPGAQKTDAKQSNKNLLLSLDALVHTRPQLEIHADDVKCTHGATIGRLDPDALFYLRSRGIGAEAARNVLIHAFTSAVLGSRVPAHLRGLLEAELTRRLEPRAERAA